MALTDRQVLDVSLAIAEAFGSPKAAARVRFAQSAMATEVRESREAVAYWREVYGCGQAVRERGGTVDELLACRVDKEGAR